MPDRDGQKAAHYASSSRPADARIETGTPVLASPDGVSPVEQRGLLWFAGILIALHLTLGLLTAAAKTPTHDEYWHLPVGLLNLSHRRFDFDLLK
jgi:hypothetical protein